MNTKHPKLLYQNFDTLICSFKCAVAPGIRAKLTEAKQTAAENRTPTPLLLGELTLLVGETGAKGGYSYIVTVGNTGVTCLIKDNDDANQWNLYIDVGSTPFVTLGYQGVLAHVEEIFTALQVDIAVPSTFRSGWPQESLARVDYCLDFQFEAPFMPERENIVTHSHRKRKIHYEDLGCADVETLTIGRSPNAQICLYNKPKEMQVKGIKHWWKVWNLNKSDKPHVWRLELRHGKESLRKQDALTFNRLEALSYRLFTAILSAMKYIEPNGTKDTNRSRQPLHPLWASATEALQENLHFDTEPLAEALEIQLQKREHRKIMYENNIIGNLTGLLALNDKPLTDAENMLDAIKQRLKEFHTLPTKKLEEKYNRKRGYFLSVGLVEE